jgi:biopolymer transport protein ExbD
MTPILDMVFQLITFFMLVVNFKNADVDTSLALPVIGSARPVDTQGQGELLVLNIDADGRLLVRGQEEPNVEKFISLEAQFLVRQAEIAKKPSEDFAVTVVIRADRAITFHLLNRVVRACQQQGFRKFDFMVMRQAAGV